MDRLAICRICLNANVSHLILGTELQEVYENLTSMPFQNTMKPSLICYICSAQLYKAHRFKLQCLKAEVLLTQIHSQLLANRDGVQEELIEIGATEITQFICTAVQHIHIEPFANVNDTVHTTYKEDVIDVEIEVKEEEYIPEPDDGLHQALHQSDIGNEQTYFDSEDDVPLNYIKEKTERVIDNQNIIRDEKKEPIEWKKGGDEVNKSKENTDLIKAAVTRSDEVTASKCKVETQTSILHESVTNREKHYKYNSIKKGESKYCQWSGASEFGRNDQYINSTCLENETQFICDICTKNYKRKWMLKRHIRIHTDKRPYSCEVCDKRFTQMGSLKTHECIHTGEKPYSCKICDKRFMEIGVLKKHKRIHTSERPYSCEICDKRFAELCVLKKHKRIHIGERPYSCKICDKKFTEKYTLKIHEGIHTGERRYSCKICDKRFTRMSHLKPHERIHTGERPYSCKMCDKRFALIGTLKKHKRIHTGERPYICKICDKRFTQIGSLKTHERIHTGEKPYSCKICDKMFTQMGSLKTHERIHTGEKPYSCKICDRKFTEKGKLNSHERIHTGEKPYSCEICDKRFTRIGRLKTHERIHTGEKSYSCKICYKRFMEMGVFF